MKKCKFCAEEIQDAAIVCKFCNKDQTQPVATSQTVNPLIPTCKLCGGTMKTSKETKSQGMGCLLALIGFFLLFLFPIGTIIGVLLLLYSVGLGSKRRGLWVCKSCGHQVERKLKWYELG